MATATNEKDEVLFLRNVPHRTKARFKTWCAQHEISMTEAVCIFMQTVTGRGDMSTVFEHEILKGKT